MSKAPGSSAAVRSSLAGVPATSPVLVMASSSAAAGRHLLSEFALEDGGDGPVPWPGVVRGLAGPDGAEGPGQARSCGPHKVGLAATGAYGSLRWGVQPLRVSGPTRRGSDLSGGGEYDRLISLSLFRFYQTRASQPLRYRSVRCGAALARCFAGRFRYGAACRRGIARRARCELQTVALPVRARRSLEEPHRVAGGCLGCRCL